MSIESRPGMVEKSVYTLRNVSIAIALIASFLGRFNIAAISAIVAISSHFTSKNIEKS